MLIDETGQLQPDPSAPPRQEQAPAAPKLTPEAAREQAKRLMQFRDFAQSRLMAWGAGDVGLHPTFKLEPWEFEMLVEAYTATMQRLGVIPPWMDIVFAEAVIMGPRIAKIFQQRKLQDENYRLRQQVNRMQRQQAAQQVAEHAAATGRRMVRRDIQKLWLVDNRGFFTHDLRKNYIKQKDRLERPDPELDWARLSKHNKPDTLKAAFNL